jgi:hypothetical protein
MTPGVPLCTQHVVAAPKTWTLACGDGNYWLSGLRWRNWGSPRATAGGVAHQNDCKPYCAAGHFHTYAVAVAVSGTLRCGTRRQYAKLVVDYAEKTMPPVVETMSCRFP